MLTVSDNHIVLGGGGGSTTFAGLSDKATADLPGINTPLANALSGKEVSTNKKTDVDANKTSDTFFPSVKAVFDWVSGLFVKGVSSSTDNAIARFDGATGKLLQNSKVVIDDNGDSYYPAYSIVRRYHPAYDILTFRGANPVDFIMDYFPNSVNKGTYIGFWSNAIGSGGNGESLQISKAYDGDVCIYTYAEGTGMRRGIRIAASASEGNDIYIKPTGTVEFNKPIKVNNAIIDNVGSSGVDGQVLKKVGGLVVWANP